MKKVSIWLVIMCLGISVIGISGLATAAEKKEVKRDIIVRTCPGTEWFNNINLSTRIKTNRLEDYLKDAEKSGEKAGGRMPVGDAISLLQIMLFEHTHPRIKIQTTSFYPTGSAAEREAKLFAAIAEGTAPSFLSVGATTLLHYTKEGILADITDYVKKWKAYEYLPKSLWGQVTLNGRIYGFPGRYVATKGVSYRKDYFKEAGLFNEKGLPAPPDNWTVEDFANIAQKLTNPKKDRWGWTVWGNFSPQDFFSVFGNFFVKPDKTGKYTWRAAFDLPAKRWFEWIKDMKWNKKCVLAGPEIDWGNYIFKCWFAGRSAMGTRWSISMASYDYRENYPEWGPNVDPRKDIGIAPPPLGPEGLRVATPVETSCYGINAVQSKEQIEASIEYARWLLEEPFSYSLFGLVKVQADKDGHYEHTTSRDIAQTIPEMYHYPKVKGFKSWDEALPKDFIDTFKKCLSTPAWPKDYSYGCAVPQDAINNRLRPVYEAVVTDPNCDIDKELAKAEALVNSSVLNYKDKDITKENFKAYYTALSDFYKETYPEYYNKWYKKLYEDVFKVW